MFLLDIVTVFVLCVPMVILIVAPIELGSDIIPLLVLWLHGDAMAAWQWTAVATGYLLLPLTCILRSGGLKGLPHLQLCATLLQLHALFFVGRGWWTTIMAMLSSIEQLCSIWQRRSLRRKLKADGKMRVMMVGDSFEPAVDGIVTYTSRAIPHFLHQGHAVAVATAAPFTQEIAPGVDIFQIAGIHLPEQFHFLTLPSLSLILAIIRWKPDVVHSFEVPHH